MSLGGRGFGTFEEDPFFSGFPSFPEIGFGGFPRHRALSDGGSRDRQLAQRRDPFGSMWPFGGEDPFARMHSMMNQMMENPENSSNAHCFSSSSVMHYSSGGDGEQPRIYQATTSTKQAPGGIKETRKTVRDSESGLQKMSIGHHINDRSHTIERRVNTKTNEKEEHQELINLEEDDAPQFDREWKEKSRQVNTKLHPSLRPSHHPRALPSLDTSSSRHHTQKHHPYDMSHHTRPARHTHAHLEPLEPGKGARASHMTDHMTRRPGSPPPGEMRHTRVKKETKAPLEPGKGARPSHMTDHMTRRPGSPPPGETQHMRVKKEAKMKKKVQF